MTGILSAFALVAGMTVSVAGGDPVISTEAGQVRGSTVSGVQAFQGIPYAAPPVGERRWRAPQRAEAWRGVRDGTKPGSKCPQRGIEGVDGSEDCLSLNVWRPGAAAKNLPVLVFLHGGGMVNGAGSLYDPAKLVARGNVVVTVNYRLGALGFLAHPELRDPAVGNFGLADQQAALGWVKRNVAAFGGDARRVTVWGESAGAFSICAQLASPTARGLFDQAIVQSGPCVNDFVARKTAHQRAVDNAAVIGCKDLECLRNKPFQDLVGLGERGFTADRRVADRTWLPVAGTPMLPFQPLVAQRLGLAIAVPTLQGGTKDEMRSHVASSYDQRGKPVTVEQYPRVLTDLYGVRDARRIVAEYPVESFPTPSLALAQVLTDEGKLVGACTQLTANDLMARRAPVYAFEFAEPRKGQPGEFPYGAHHGVDVQYFLGSTDPGPWTPPPLTGEQAKLSERLLDQWSAFAAAGRPGWPQYRKDVVNSISTTNPGPVNLRSEHRCDFWESL